MPGDSQSLTIPGIQENLRTVTRSKFTVKEANSGKFRELKSYKVGMQVSHGIDAKISEEDIV
jgi:hypothetical protein